MKKLVIVVGGATLLALWVCLHTYLKHSSIEDALATGRLAPLPAKALTLQVDTEGNIFSRTFWVSFQAPARDVEQWVRQSPTLAQAQPITCQRPVLAGEHPTWFQPASIQKGLLYQIPQDSNANYGTVWIDQETNTVYVKTSHS